MSLLIEDTVVKEVSRLRMQELGNDYGTSRSEQKVTGPACG